MEISKCKLLALCLLVFGSATAQQYPEMVMVTGGSFTMGNNDEKADKIEKPAHGVTVSSFEMAKYETTVAEFKEFCTATNRKMPNAPSWGWIDNHPMVNVNNYDAKDYCKWLSGETDKTYRLPTEAEWEFAAIGGINSKGFLYAGSNNIKEVGWVKDNSSKKAMPVGTKKPNELGIYDMSGNVWEWTADTYKKYTADTSTNPTNIQVGFIKFKVIRGGSWDNTMEACTPKKRGSYLHTRDRFYTGFRVVALQ